MIIDSHAHYSHTKFNGMFPYLYENKGEYAVQNDSRETILQEMKNKGITACIEPAIDLASNDSVLSLCRKYPSFFFPAIGVHPTRTDREKWKSRNKLAELAKDSMVIAIGETGLDYHYARRKQHRLRQFAWFIHQIDLAHQHNLPLILHIRKADRHALFLLRHYKAKLHGGAVHCFHGDWKTARKYLELGFHIGIGASLLQMNQDTEAFCDAVQKIPLDRILIETDSPYVLPDCGKDIPKKTRNTSLILPKIIQKIAEIKNVSPILVEKVTFENTVHLFRLPDLL